MIPRLSSKGTGDHVTMMLSDPLLTAEIFPGGTRGAVDQNTSEVSADQLIPCGVGVKN